MTDRSDLPERLRTLAAHRACILGKTPESMEEWQAAEEIAELREALKPFADEYETVATAYYRRDDVDMRLINAPTDNTIMLSDLRRARAKLEGGSND